MKAAVQQYGADSVVEVGSGTGRNLLFPKSQLPHLEKTLAWCSAAAPDAAAAVFVQEAFRHHKTIAILDAD